MSLMVEMMYQDLSRRRVSLSNRAALPRTGVLFIILSAPDTERPRLNGYRRVAEKFGTDWYWLGELDGAAQVNGWDDRDFRWVPLDDPFNPLRESQPPWLDPEALIFEGGYLKPEAWERAKAVYYADMH